MGMFSRRSRQQPEMVVFQRHVALSSTGLGATFKRVLRSDGTENWVWSYDTGLVDDLHTMMATEKAVTALEKELGLPLTWPHLDPDAPKPKRVEPTEAERRERIIERLKNDPDDPVALQQLWSIDAKRVDPADLIEGRIYSISFDLGIYKRNFYGPQWMGVSEFEDDPGSTAQWYIFENAESKSEDGTRISEDDWFVRELPVSQSRAREVYDQLRSRYLAWDAQRGPTRYF